jgi:hypothetical protein
MHLRKFGFLFVYRCLLECRKCFLLCGVVVVVLFIIIMYFIQLLYKKALIKTGVRTRYCLYSFFLIALVVNTLFVPLLHLSSRHYFIRLTNKSKYNNNSIMNIIKYLFFVYHFSIIYINNNHD